MDQFSTEFLMGVVEDLKVPASWALDNFFPTQESFTTEAVDIEIIDRKRRLAPLVSPLSPGRVMNQTGREVRSLKPAYIKDKREFQPDAGFKRAVGEAIGGTLTPQQRIELAIAAEAQDQINMATRRQEMMAIEQLRTGKLALTGPDYPAVNIDFLRDASLTVDVSVGATAWDQATSDPLADLQTWALLAKQKSGVFPRVVTMAVDVFSAFVSHAKVKDRWQAQNAQLINIALKTGDALEDAATYMGRIEGFEIWVYADWFIDDNGVEQDALPAGELFMAHARADGMRLYGAIRDHDSLQAVPYFLKSFRDNDPSVRYLLMQSAPLPALRRPNATVGATVK